jgi:hypothetical protein
MKIVLALLATLPLMACTSGAVEETNFFDSTTKPSVNPQKMTTDWAQCQADNPSIGMSDAERKVARQCMSAKGYGTREKGL